MRSTPDVEANLASAAALTRQAAERGAALVLLPEAFAYIGPDAGKRAIEEPLPGGGPILAFCQRLAQQTGVEMILGGFHERPGTLDAGDDRNHNTSVHLGRDGSVRALYRKIHLFDVDLADGTQLNESSRTAPGHDIVCTDSAIGRVGMTVCYDVRFPPLYERLVDDGAIALTVPSAFTASTGQDHWHVLLRARAIECQSYVLAAAQWGHHHGTRHSYGHALIADPWGVVVAECGLGDGVAIAPINARYVADVRRQLPSLANRRLTAAAGGSAQSE